MAEPIDFLSNAAFEIPGNAPLPTPEPGNLLIVGIQQAHNLVIDEPPGWAKSLEVDNGFTHIAVFSKISDGTETDFAVSSGVSTAPSGDSVSIALVYTDGVILSSAAVTTNSSSTLYQPVLFGVLTGHIAFFTAAQLTSNIISSLGADITLISSHSDAGTVEFQAGGYDPVSMGLIPAEVAETTGDAAQYWASVAVSIGPIILPSQSRIAQTYFSSPANRRNLG